MRIFKFGGASVKSAEAVRNVNSIIEQFPEDKMIIIISAMGKTTNTLEKVTTALFQKNFKSFDHWLSDCKDFHTEIIEGLFESSHPITDEITSIFDDLYQLKEKRIGENYDFIYDQIVSFGEIISTKIVVAYLKSNNLLVDWCDARTFIRTDNEYRSASINWEKTHHLINEKLSEKKGQICVTQGFIGHTDEGFSTTLGREGSDFTAAIIAYCLQAKDVTIWKDVPGMLNADPKYFQDTIKLDKISYKEAIELAYYGASVIHPKTVQPLQNKNIPLFIKSFVVPSEEGTIIQSSTDSDDLVPSFIFKVNQVLLSITSKQFSFIVEEHLSSIFKQIATFKGHINVMQNSAVSFTVCLDIEKFRLEQLIASLAQDFNVKYNDNVELVTIRHYDQATINRVTKNKENLMEQRTRNTVRIVLG